MKYLDTNIVIRVVTGDNPDLAKRAINEIQACSQNGLCLLDAILVEVCFVLEFHDYKMARHDIADALTTLVATPQIYVTAVTIAALKLYKQMPKLDYADCLLVVVGGS